MSKDVYIHNPSTNIKLCLYILSCIVIISVTDYNMNGAPKCELGPSGDTHIRGETEHRYFSVPLHI